MASPSMRLATVRGRPAQPHPWKVDSEGEISSVADVDDGLSGPSSVALWDGGDGLVAYVSNQAIGDPETIEHGPSIIAIELVERVYRGPVERRLSLAVVVLAAGAGRRASGTSLAPSCWPTSMASRCWHACSEQVRACRPADDGRRAGSRRGRDRASARLGRRDPRAQPRAGASASRRRCRWASTLCARCPMRSTAPSSCSATSRASVPGRCARSGSGTRRRRQQTPASRWSRATTRPARATRCCCCGRPGEWVDELEGDHGLGRCRSRPTRMKSSRSRSPARCPMWIRPTTWTVGLSS